LLAATKLAFVQTPATGTAGQALGTVTVDVEDASGNVVATDTSRVTIAVATGPGGFTFFSTTRVSAVAGVATFNNLTLDTSGTYTLKVTDGTLTPATSGNIVVGAGTASQLAYQQTPATGTAGQALSPSVTVDVEDAFGNVVTTDTSTVTVAVNSGPGGFTAGSTTSVAAVRGVATFSNLVLDTAGTYRLRATDGSLNRATSGNIVISAAAASQLGYQQIPAGGISGQALTPSVTVAIEDAFGNVVTSNTSTVTIAVASGPGGFTAGSMTSVGAVSGVATFSNLVLNTLGTYTVKATDAPLTAVTSGNVVITGPATQLVFQQVPATATAGSAITPSVIVDVEDASGDIVAGNTSTVTIAVATGPGGFGFFSTTRVAAVNGVATFSNLVLNTSGTYTLTVTDGSLTPATSSGITVTQPSTQLAYFAQPGNITAGGTLSRVVVEIENSSGNLVTTDTSSVTIAIASGPAGAVLGGTTTVAATFGIATFSTLTLTKAGTYTLIATDGSLTPATSVSFAVSPAAANQLAVQQSPTTAGTGQALNPSIQIAIEDQYGNVVTSNTSTVSIAVASGPGGFAAGSTTSVAAVSGVATFSNLVLDTPGTYTLKATDGTLTSVTTGNIVVAATPSKLVYQQTDSIGTAGQALSPSFTVAVEDSLGNVVTSDTSMVTIAIASGPGGFASGSTTSVAAVNGIATFSNLLLDTAGTYTLKVTDGALTSATSGNIVIGAAGASQLAYQTTPTTGSAEALSPSVSVAIEDAFGNVVTSNTSTLTIAVATGPAGFAAGSTTAVAAVSGVATFSNLVLDTAGAYTLSMSDGPLPDVITGTITISPAAARQLVLQQSPTSGTAGQALSPSVTVDVEDAFGNLMTTDSSTVTIAIASGPGGFATGSTTSVPAASGVATFSNLLLDTAGTYSLKITDGTLTSATTGNVVISAAGASQLGYQQTPTTGTAGQALSPSVTVAVEDAFGNVIATDTSTVTIAIASGPGGLATGSTTSAPATNGVATFSNLVFDTAGNYTLSVSDGGLTGVTTGPITVNPAAATQLLLQTSPTSGAAGQALGTLSVTLEDSFGNIATNDSSTVTVMVASGPGGFAAGSTTSVHPASGLATFSNLILDTAGAYTFSMSDGSLPDVITGTITISPAAASQLVLEQSPTNGTAGQALGTLSVAVTDAFGNVITTDTSSAAVAVATGPGGFATGSTTGVTAASGVATFSNLLLDTAGSYTLSVTDGTLTGVTTGTITISPTSPSQLVFQQTPTTGTAGQALSPSVSVDVEDAFGNVVTTDTSTVTIAVATGPAGFATGSTTSAPAMNGVATFSNLLLDTVGNYTLSVSDGALTGATSGTIAISSGAATQLVLEQSPTSGTAGQALSTLSVVLKDNFGNIATNNSSTVTASIATGPGGFATSSTTNVSPANGVATFSNLVLDTAGGYTLSVTDGSLTGVTTGIVTISPAAASQLALQQSPTGGTAGQALGTLSVAVEDAFSNVVTTNSSTVAVSITTGPGGFATGSTTSVPAASGVAAFSNLVLDTAGGYTLSFSDGGLTPATTGTITVGSASAVKLVLEQTPTSGTAGQALSPSVTVAVEDVFGNVVTSDASTVTVTLTSGSAGFAAGSTTSVSAAGGVATFSYLIFDTAGSYTLSLGDGGLTGAATGPIAVSPASASQLGYQQTPTTGTAGQTLTPSIKVTVEDAFANLVTTDNSTVAIAVVSGPGGFTTGSTTSVAAVNGVATLSNLILDTAGTYTLQVTDGTLASATSGNVVIGAAAASQLGYEQIPSTGQTGQPLSPSVIVAVEDTFGNVVTSNTSSVTIAVASGPGGFAAGSTTSVHAVGGVATFSNLFLNTPGTYTLNATDGTLAGITSPTITINIGPPAIAAPTSAIVSANGSLVFSASNGNALSLTDFGAGQNTDSLTMTVSNGVLILSSTNGLIFSAGSNDAATFTVKGTVANLNAALSSVTYQPNANYVGSDSLAISVFDSTDGKSGSATIALTVTPYPPSITAPASASLSENGSLTFSTGGGNAISITDANPGAVDSVSLSVGQGTLTLSTTAGLSITGTNGTASFTVSGSVSNLNSALNGLVYTPTALYVGADSLTLSLTDAGDNLSASKNVSLAVNALPSPTTSAPANALVNMNGTLVFSAANGNLISVADAAAGANTDSLTLSAGHGTLTLSTTSGLTFAAGTSNGTASFTVTGTVANLNAALSGLTYKPTTNYTGSDSLAVSITDSGDVKSASTTVALGVGLPFITAPSAAFVAVNGSLVFSSTNSNPISVADSGPGNNADSLTLTATHGTLTLSTTSGLTITTGANGSATITVTGSVANLNAALNGVTYKPTTGYTGSDSVAISLKDSVDNLSASTNVALTISSPPAITAPATATVAINSTLVFSTANKNAVSIADVNAGSTVEPLTLAATDGTLSLGSTSGITFTSGTNNSASMTISGTLANLNAALSGLTFLPAKIGSGTVVLSYTDLGNDLKASATINITVTKGITKLVGGSPVSPSSPAAAGGSSVSGPTGGGSTPAVSPTNPDEALNSDSMPADAEVAP